MVAWKKPLAVISILLVSIAVIYLLFSFLYMDFTAERWWFQSLGYGGYFWRRQLYRYAVLIFACLFFFLIFAGNFQIAIRMARLKPGNHAPGQNEATRTSSKIKQLLLQGSPKLFVPLFALTSLAISYPLYQKWEASLLFLFGPAAHIADPVFSRDISFYLFTLPIERLLQTRLLVGALILLASITGYYWFVWHARARSEDNKWVRGARIHLSILSVAAFLILIWQQLLLRFQLLYEHRHQLFFGPGFVEMRIDLPLIWITALLLLVLCGSFVLYLNRSRSLKLVILCAALVLVSLGLRGTTFLHHLVQSYVVRPNEISRESSFIRNSIQATLHAYALDKVENREYTLQELPSLSNSPAVASAIKNIPVWDGELLNDVFKQLQGIRPYYRFTGVDVDRYRINKTLQQVFLGPRELNLDGLPESAKNWINLHLKYTHGMGAVMTPAAQSGEEPITWYLKDIPPRSAYSLPVKHQAIYFGLGDYDYSIAPSDIAEMDYASADSSSVVHYKGKGGASIGSFFRKLFYALYFHDSNILFTTKTNARSRILYRRNIVDRIKQITPFLTLDRDPYLVITTKGLTWIVDGYTGSDWYPSSEPHGKFNYVRNAVKISVDAYDGTVNYYVSDPDDPIITAYQRIYPSLLQPMSKMPAEIRGHLRYPKDLFEIQMSIFAKYHQQDPERFYNQEDTWKFAEIYKGDTPLPITPYYLTLELLDPGQQEFLLLAPMSPKGLDTLRALVVAECDGSRYGKISVLRFPKGTQVYGPSQINALIDQDTSVSQEFTPWDQVGSAVERGRMTILPVAGDILYVQPVYLQSATRLKIPELKRVILTQGDFVVMDRNLEDGFKKLDMKLQELRRRQRGESQSGQGPGQGLTRSMRVRPIVQAPKSPGTTDANDTNRPSAHE